MNSIFEEHRSLFTAILNTPVLHARFLNTLSLMELAGAQRLSRVVAQLPNRTFLLEHVAEEYRHAYFLRRLASKIDLHMTDDFNNVFCRTKSVNYISHINRTTCVLLFDFNLPIKTNLPYLLTTFVVERRALPFYGFYQSLLDRMSFGISVKSIISEEEAHLKEITRQISDAAIPPSLIHHCIMMENQLFNTWLNAIGEEIQRYRG